VLPAQHCVRTRPPANSVKLDDSGEYMKLDFGRPVGETHPPFIIAAMDCRELGTLERALAAIDVAAKSNVDAIKMTRMPIAWSAQLIDRAEARNLTLFAPALDESDVIRLDWLGASGFYLFFNWSDLELVERAAATGKPIVLQVGTASQAELAEIVSRRPRRTALSRLGRRYRRSVVVLEDPDGRDPPWREHRREALLAEARCHAAVPGRGLRRRARLRAGVGVAR
jgi:hypothetical protein